VKNYVRLLIFTCSVLLSSCDGGYETPKVRTPEMETQAKRAVINYLSKKGLPPEGLAPFKSKVKPEPGFSYLYTGSGRCIEIIVLCYGKTAMK
jgi:hypothetical protein